MACRRSTGQWFVLALAGAFALMLGFDALCVALRLAATEGVRRQIDITQEGNLAAWFSALAFAGVAWVSLRLTRRGQRIVERIGWLSITIAFTCYAVTTALAIHDLAARGLLDALRPGTPNAPGSSLDGAVAALFTLEALGVLGLLAIWLFVTRAMRGARRAVLLASLGLALMLCSPFAEHVEDHMLNDPHNYVFVTNKHGYRMTRAAADRLWLASHVKEGVETGGAIALMAGLLAFREQRSAARVPRD